MYCSECKLRVADDSVTVCPVCQGRLQVDEENEKAFNDAVDNKGSAVSGISVEDKFSAYEKPDQSLDFNPKEIGLQASDPGGQVEEDEDIRALADLWDEEDIDADLEGVLAEAFSLDEANDDIDEVDDLDLELGRSEVLASRPSVTSANRNLSPLLLLLLIVLIGAGGASWFYLQKTGIKSEPIAKPRSLPQSKESVTADKAATTEPAREIAGSSAGVKTAKLAAAVPVQDLAQVKVAAHKVKDVETPPEKVVTDQSTAVSSQSSDGGLEKLAGRQAEVLDKPVSSGKVKAALSSAPIETATEAVKKSEVLVAAQESVGEKALISEKAVIEGDAKVVEQLTPSSSTSLKDESGKSAEKTATKVVTSKVEVSSVFHYAVHIGSFKSQKRVARQLAMLQEKGFAAYQVEVDLKEKGVWQRVMIPGGATRDEAKALQKKLAELFPKEDSLIKKIKK
ncbi:MAG: SPOR domain-containing protein [Deltaproteobacteria bacterium]|nr:SPOR domain-containing protein [Candidatus Tharpella sp.]